MNNNPWVEATHARCTAKDIEYLTYNKLYRISYRARDSYGRPYIIGLVNDRGKKASYSLHYGGFAPMNIKRITPVRYA